jgi:ArsR family transcriptional regulator
MSIDITVSMIDVDGTAESEVDAPRVLTKVAPLEAVRLARIAKALSDPVRVRLVDVLRRHGGEVCVCDLQPLFDITQPTLSHHLKKLLDAGLAGVDRRGLWAYYYVLPDAFDELSAWLDGGER